MPSVERLGDWELHAAGPAGAEHTVLLIAGALCSAAFFAPLMAEPSLSSIRLVAATLPGYAGTTPPADASVEHYAASASELAAHVGCDAVLGHSFGANVALEMAASGGFSGRLGLLSPSFSRRDESRVPRVLDGLGRVLGALPYAAAFTMIGVAMNGSVPLDQHAILVGEMMRNDPHAVRRQTRRYLEYLDRHGSLVSRLCSAEVRTWVLFGEHDDIRLAAVERRELETCPDVTLRRVADAGHFTMNQQPTRIAAVVAEMLEA